MLICQVYLTRILNTVRILEISDKIMKTYPHPYLSLPPYLYSYWVLSLCFVVEVRFVAKDDIYLSPAFGRDVCFIGIIMYRYVNLIETCSLDSND